MTVFSVVGAEGATSSCECGLSTGIRKDSITKIPLENHIAALKCCEIVLTDKGGQHVNGVSIHIEPQLTLIHLSVSRRSRSTHCAIHSHHSAAAIIGPTRPIPNVL